MGGAARKVIQRWNYTRDLCDTPSTGKSSWGVADHEVGADAGRAREAARGRRHFGAHLFHHRRHLLNRKGRLGLGIAAATETRTDAFAAIAAITVAIIAAAAAALAHRFFVSPLGSEVVRQIELGFVKRKHAQIWVVALEHGEHLDQQDDKFWNFKYQYCRKERYKLRQS